jgi:hypothetical protein
LSISASLIAARRAGVERRIERLGPQRVQQRMTLLRRGDPQQRAEPARIVVAKQRSVVEYDVDMIVLPARRRVAEDPQRAGHAEVHEQCRCADVKQQVLAASVDALDDAPAHADVEIGGNRPAQTWVVHVDPNHAPAGYMRRDSTPRRFDFRELRHRGGPRRTRAAAWPRRERCGGVCDGRDYSLI